jgi:hypothetical protein
MSRKIFWIILIPALLLVGGFMAVQVWLRTSTPPNGEKDKQQFTSTQHTAASGKAAKASAKQDDVNTEVSKDDGATSVQAVSATTDIDSSKKTSPLDLRPLLIKKMQQLVKKSSNGLYDLSVGDLTLDVLTSTVALHGVQLRPDAVVLQNLKSKGLLPQQVLSLSFDDLLIDGVNIDDAITSKTMDYKLVKLVNPVIEIDRYKAGKKTGSDGDFSQRFLQQMEKLAVGKLQVQGGSITVHDKVNGGTKKLRNIAVLMKDILLNEATRNDRSRFLFAREAQLEFHDFSLPSKDGLYTMRIGDAFINATGKKVELKNVSYRSPLSKQAFVSRQKEAKEKYDLQLPAITITGVDWWEAMNGDEISAAEVKTNGGKMAVYFDRSLPPKNKMGGFPNQLLTKLTKQLDIDKINLRNLSFEYEEFNPKTKQAGTLTLDKVAMVMTNVTNKKSNQKPMAVSGTALLMGEVPVATNFTFDMKNPQLGGFTATLKLDSFQAPLMNSVAAPLGLMKVDRGEIQSVNISMKGNEKEAAGEALVRYDELKISLLKKKGDAQELKEKKLFSLLANMLLVKNDNPWWLNDETRKKETYFKRDPEGGFMNLVWKTAFVGLLKSIGAPAKLAEKK